MNQPSNDFNDYCVEREGKFYCKKCNKPLQEKKIRIKKDEYKMRIFKCSCLEDRKKAKKLQAILDDSGIMKEDLDIITRRHPRVQFDPEKILGIGIKYLKNLDKLYQMRKGLFLVGRKGIAKTITINYIMYRIAQKNLVRIKYITAEDLQRLFDSYDRNDRKKYDSILRCPIVFVDDIGFQRWNMYPFWNYRINNYLITFGASNISNQKDDDGNSDLENNLTAPVISRIKYKCIWDDVTDEKDLRIQEGK